MGTLHIEASLNLLVEQTNFLELISDFKHLRNPKGGRDNEGRTDSVG